MLTSLLFFAAGIALLWVGTDAVLRRMFVTTHGRFIRSEALVMIALFVLFLSAQFMGFGLSLP